MIPDPLFAAGSARASIAICAFCAACILWMVWKLRRMDPPGQRQAGPPERERLP